MANEKKSSWFKFKLKEWMPMLYGVPAEDLKQAFLDAIDYQNGLYEDDAKDRTPSEEMFFALIRREIDDAEASYRAKGNAHSLSDILQYCAEAGIRPDIGQKFFNYYEKASWKRDGKPVRSWKSLLDSWAKNERNATADSSEYEYYKDGDTL